MSDDPVQPVPYATPHVGPARRGHWLILLLGIGLVCAVAAIAVLGWFLYSGQQVQINTNVAPTPPVPRVTKVQPTMSKDNVELAIHQRQSATIPGSNNTVLVSLDDITGGQVIVTVSDANGATLMSPTSMSEGAVGTFAVSKQVYDVKLKQLHNKLVGSDFGVIAVFPTTGPARN